MSRRVIGFFLTTGVNFRFRWVSGFGSLAAAAQQQTVDDQGESREKSKCHSKSGRGNAIIHRPARRIWLAVVSK
jgi:hypothetical protein